MGRELTTTEQVDLVSEHAEEHGLNRCFEAAGLPKSTWYYRQRHWREGQSQEEKILVSAIRDIVVEHPAYGYRRILPELRARTSLRPGHKRLRRLLNGYDLGLRRCLPRARTSAARRMLSDHAGKLNLVKKRLAELGAGPSGLIVHHDQDSVYTSHDGLRQPVIEDGARVSYSENGTKDNPWIESPWGRFKTENESLIREAESIAELTEIVSDRFDYYNRDRRHSALQYEPPLTYLHHRIDREDTSCRLSAN